MKNNNKKFLNTFIFISIYIVLHSFIEDIISKIIVSPILQTIKSSWVLDIIFAITIVYILINAYTKIKRRYYLSVNNLLINIVIVLFVLFYRIENSPWEFLSLKSISPIKYIDILFIYSFSNILIFVCFCIKSTDKDKEYKGFIYDEPINENSPDLLNREKFAKYIGEKITKTNSKKSAFAIGINGKWGSGKTSFFYLIKKHLKQEDNIIIEFNPWLSHSDKLMTKDFFNELKQKLSPYNSELSHSIQNYIDLLLEFDNSIVKNAVNSIKKIGSENLILSEFDNINTAIQELKKKIIIFIDDIDRLDENEIFEIVKIIRNSANFGNLFFIVAYDRNYLITALKKINPYGSEYYLEKIFQLEIPLPKYEISKIRQKLYDLINPQLTKKDQDNFYKLIFDNDNIFETNIISSEIISTLRDVTRFANSFLISYNFLNGEIVLSDLLVVEQLRLKFPSIYNEIFNNPDKYLTTGWFNNKNYYSLLKNKEQDNNLSKYEYRIEEYINDNNLNIEFSNSQNKIILNLLFGIFPSLEGYRMKEIEELSVANPDKFNIYSHYRLLDSDISEIEFSKLRKGSFEEFKTRIDEWLIEDKHDDLRQKLIQIKDFSNITDFENILKAIFYFAGKEPKNRNSLIYGFDYQNLKQKLGKFENRSIFYNSDKNEYKIFICSLFENAKDPYLFESYLIHSILNDFNYEFIISKEELDKLRIKYLRKYLTNNGKMSMIVWHLYHNCNIDKKINNSSNSYEIKTIRNSKANELLINHIKNNRNALLDFLNWSIEPNFPSKNKSYKISLLVIKIFGDFVEFETFLEIFNNKEDIIINEYIEFYKLFKETNYNKYISFNFKHINPHNRPE